jgi:hypothetical protein
VKKSKSKGLSKKEIDEIIVAQANDSSAWEEPIYVHKPGISAVATLGKMKSKLWLN